MSTQLLRAVAMLGSRELLDATSRLVARENEATTELIAHIAEVDRRRLYLATGFSSSIFGYCTRVLHLSEYAAYTRIQAARAARRFPVLLEKLADGSLNLTGVGMLAPHLTRENCLEVLDLARHRSKRQVEQLIAQLRPVEEVPPPSIRKLPTLRPFAAAAANQAAVPANQTAAASARGSTRPGALPPEIAPPFDPAPPVPVDPRAMIIAAEPISTETSVPARARFIATSPAHRPIVTALTPERYRIQFTAGAGTYLKLRRAQDLLRHQVPDGNPAVIVDRALTTLLVDLARRKFAALSERPGCSSRQPRTDTAGVRSRYIPAGVRRRVWLRDGGQCTFVSPDGRRCPERGWLEFHHVDPHAWGGPAVVQNIQLRCRAHNQYEAGLIFGDRGGAGRPE